MLQATLAGSAMTIEELAARVGAVPLWRIRTDPAPGTATEEDVERIWAVEKQACELLDGVLLEKAASELTSFLGIEIARLLGNWVRTARLGWILGSNGFFWLSEGRLRAPDVSFIGRHQLPNRKLPSKGHVEVAPLLAVEVFSPGNTVRELEQKRAEFFAAGTELFWLVYPDRQEIEVSTSPDSHRLLGRNDTLDGGSVLPGFAVKIGEIFDAAEMGGN
ncbi:Uma2 family endonuclease [Planctomicrobium piriforme]|uniref:Endonuclease, Uma2 family (Restriction endonuclease fold) n=1 Tax=Planctomicrobium piriforme TaxID=1576369 RepID=A0A1I3BNG3_9PLAN|nr:Uma2 family endonuclease [Planctomicrobium piriforme]SFH63321.1 Endonuclease, Uma2 family (restriction endonuclease fold) [Planctomicrobium piriforme]